ncbi:MAG TPA: competence/damage-inducible protein A, partial [Rhodospirillaceae bacterium]|nr:competence/damage-inducible protein A [Rhodospirillaceae bacterium]
MSEAVRACLIIIGNEILSGRTHDKNLPYIAEKLNGVGVRLTEARVIPDIPDIIIRTVRELSANFTYVFTTGGIGPTHDDITADCVAEAMGVSIDIDPEALRRLEIHYQNSGLEINEARLRMARIPAGATLIDNPISAAPGFRIGNVHVMAGVPKIM